jgi:hypothetical protein
MLNLFLRSIFGLALLPFILALFAFAILRLESAWFIKAIIIFAFLSIFWIMSKRTNLALHQMRPKSGFYRLSRSKGTTNIRAKMHYGVCLDMGINPWKSFNINT